MLSPVQKVAVVIVFTIMLMLTQAHLMKMESQIAEAQGALSVVTLRFAFQYPITNTLS